jgi:hypothetical protein
MGQRVDAEIRRAVESSSEHGSGEW